MKNIHILPTPNPSRLYINSRYKHYEFCEIPRISTQHKKCYNIYITSDEEIKQGDYVCASGGFRFVKTLNNDRARTFTDDGIVSKQNPLSSCHLSNYKKIILTTDQDLIKDGVQAIDDEFLEWFVGKANDSGKPIDVVEIQKDKCLDTSLMCDCVDEPCRNKGYKIVIPKEEPKQDLEKEMFELEQELDIPSHLRWHNSKPKQTVEEYEQQGLEKYSYEPKQETLEEVAEWVFEDIKDRSIFLRGAKFSREQTIEEVFEWLTTNNYLTDLKETMIKDFNKFKNK